MRRSKAPAQRPPIQPPIWPTRDLLVPAWLLAPLRSPALLSWSFTVSNAGPPPCALTLTINRGCLVNSSGNNCLPPATAAPDLIGTQVSIQYAYNWHFNTVVTVLVPSSTYAGTTTLKTSGVALNEN